MQVKLTIQSPDLSREQLLALLNAIRGCERQFMPKKLLAILVKTTPRLPMEEVARLFQKVTPGFASIYSLPLEDKDAARVLELGSRLVALAGKVVGTCDRLILTIAEATEEEIQDLEQTQAITLIRPGEG